MNFRIAPSPTGDLHLGNLYVFFANYIASQQEERNFILRFDDTDRNRNKSNEKTTVNILKDLDFKLPSIFVQSKRKKIYKNKIKELLNQKFAYFCDCTKNDICSCKNKTGISSKKAIKINTEKIISYIKKNADLEKQNVRFVTKNEEEFLFIDNNNISFPIKIMNDFYITRSDGTFLYHICSCIDDIEFKITKIIRAEEWITSLWKHFLIFNVLTCVIENVQIPSIEHVVLLLNEEGKKLSKREKSVSINYLINELKIEKETIRIYIYSLLVRKNNKKPYDSEDELVNDVLNKEEKKMFLLTKENFYKNFSRNKSSPKLDIKKLIFFNKKVIQIIPDKIKKILINFPEKNKLKKIFEFNDFFYGELRNTFKTEKELHEYFSFVSFTEEDIKETIKSNNLSIAQIVQTLLLHKKILKEIKLENNNNDKDKFDYYVYKKKLETHKEIEYTNYLHILRFAFLFKKKGLSINLILNCIKSKNIQNRINFFQRLNNSV